MAVVFGGDAGGVLDLMQFLEALLVAEAVVGVALFDQLLGVLFEHPHPLGLDVGADRAADVGAFVPDQAGLAERVVDDFNRAFDVAVLVGILDAQDEGAVVFFRDQVGVKRSAQVADVHVAGGAGGKPGADFLFFHWKIPSKNSLEAVPHTRFIVPFFRWNVKAFRKDRGRG